MRGEPKCHCVCVCVCVLSDDDYDNADESSTESHLNKSSQHINYPTKIVYRTKYYAIGYG